MFFARFCIKTNFFPLFLYSVECFIEGSRSRTGKLLPPKLGILKYVVEALENGRTEDVWICPVSVQYDKVIETNSYINE